mmetsp:Transcript_12833/g.29496  ORF Transcript_12833/g.29496 Transcript_12833/m.29496 type:complete len:368 (+) Transcript_12833:126-1229(+)
MRRTCVVGIATTCTLALFVADTFSERIYTLKNASTEKRVIRDERPVGSNGYLCIHGAKGRLNNLILQNLVGVHMAHHINRTLLVDDEVAKYYDVDALSLSTFPNATFRVAMPLSGVNETCYNPSGRYNINHRLTITERFEEFQEQTQQQHSVAAVDNSDVWYWLGRPPEDVYGRFFRGLILRDVYQRKVEEFLRKHNLHEDSFNAVHLRFFEGQCGRFETYLCCPKLGYVQDLIMESNGSLLSPLFVANDRQCSEEILATYTNSTDPVLVGYDGECDGTECAVLDFELCVQSHTFVGNVKSSGDMNIREWRVARYKKPKYSSIISRDPDILKMENETTHLTRYIIGHWRFRPDCNDVGAGQRGQPCV